MRSANWIDRHNLLLRVDSAELRSQQTIDDLCIRLEPLGDTLAVVVHVQNAAATLVLLPLAWHEGSLAQMPAAASVWPLAWLILVNSVGGFSLLFVLIRHGAASAVAALFFLMPPVTAVFGLAWFGESLTPAKVAGFALSAAGVWLATRAASAVPARR